MRLSAPDFCMRRKLRNFVSLPLPRITFNLVAGDSINVQRSNVPALVILRWDGGEQGRPAIEAHQCSNTRKCSFNATGKGLSGSSGHFGQNRLRNDPRHMLYEMLLNETSSSEGNWNLIIYQIYVANHFFSKTAVSKGDALSIVYHAFSL